MIITVLCYVPYPGQRLIPAFLHDLQVTNLDTGNGEVRYLELNRDRLLHRVDGRAGVGCADRGQPEMRAQQKLFLARKLLDAARQTVSAATYIAIQKWTDLHTMQSCSGTYLALRAR